MSRNCPIIYFICAVLVIVCSADKFCSPRYSAVSAFLLHRLFYLFHQARLFQPSLSTNFIPTGPNYPDTNAGTNVYNFMPGAAQSQCLATSGTAYLSIPQSDNQAAIYPSPEPVNPGANPALRRNPYLPATLEPERPLYFEEAWTWQYLPDSLLYQSYLAGNQRTSLCHSMDP